MNFTDRQTRLRHELAYLDIDICDKHYEIGRCSKHDEMVRLRRELDILERRHHEVLTELRRDAA